MYKITLKIDGMMCGMCEAHINDTVRKAFSVKKVTSSRARGVTEILTEADLSEDVLKSVIDKTGYTLLSMEKAPFEKKGLFHRG